MALTTTMLARRTLRAGARPLASFSARRTMATGESLRVLVVGGARLLAWHLVLSRAAIVAASYAGMARRCELDRFPARALRLAAARALSLRIAIPLRAQLHRVMPLSRFLLGHGII